MRVQKSGNEEVKTWGFAERHCDLGAEDLGLTSALYELGALGKGFTLSEPPFYPPENRADNLRPLSFIRMV